MSTGVMNRNDDEEIERRLSAGPSGREALKAVDVHVHFIPPGYRSALAEAGITHPDGYHGGVPAWTAESHLEQMEEFGIATSIVSISSPGVTISEHVDPVALARTVNEEGASLVADHPGRFGFLASLPLLQVDAAIEEIAYAFDELGALGVTLQTNTDGIYLGDERLAPILAELARREARVHIHPTEPSVLVPGAMTGWSRSMYEFFFDTTRAVTNLIFSGALTAEPGIRLIVPHAGAAIPALAQRIERNVWRANRLETRDEALPSYLDTLARCYFDLAGSVLPHQTASLLALAPETNILYGSDFPHTNRQLGSELTSDLRSTDLLSEQQKAAFLRTNALALFPELAPAQKERHVVNP